MAGGRAGADGVVTEFATYTDFLDSQITPRDLYYLEVYIIYIGNVGRGEDRGGRLCGAGCVQPQRLWPDTCERWVLLFECDSVIP